MTGGAPAAEDSVSAVIDQAPLGHLHSRIFLMCAAIMTLDGFDLGLLGFVVPAISADWGLPPSSFGFALSASLIGVAFGSAIAGWMGDRFGRRTALLWMFVIGAVGSLLTAFATDLTTLSAFRFITGFGMGGTIPNVVSLVNEFSPKRRRPFLVVLVYSMAAIGSVFASLLAAPLIGRFGWESMFVVGGALPLLIGAVAFFLLPESVRFLIASGRDRARSAELLQRLSGRSAEDELLRRALTLQQGAAAAAVPSTQLFAGWLQWVTPMLWVVFIGTQALVFFNSSWLPTLLKQGGEPGLQATNVYEEVAHRCDASPNGGDRLTNRTSHLPRSTLYGEYRLAARKQEEDPVDGKYDADGDKASLRIALSTIAGEHGSLAQWALVGLGDEHLLERLNLFQNDAGATHNAGERIIRNTNWHSVNSICRVGSWPLNSKADSTRAAPLLKRCRSRNWRRRSVGQKRL